MGAIWYHRDHKDLVGTAITQGLSGLIRRWGNIAQMESNGIELSLSSTNIRTKDFSWTSSLSYTHRSNKITKLYTEPNIDDMVKGTGFARQGYSKGSIFSIPFAGLSDLGLPTFYDEHGEKTISGIQFDSHNVDFLTYSGSTIPTDLGGLNNTLRYKNWSLTIYLSYSFGNVLRLRPFFAETQPDYEVLGKEIVNRWQLPGDEASTDIPRLASYLNRLNDASLSRAYNAYNYSTARIAKGDYIRLRDISLSYSFDKATVQKLGCKSLGIKLQASNFLLIYADKRLNGADPAKYDSYTPKQITMTLNVGL